MNSRPDQHFGGFRYSRSPSNSSTFEYVVPSTCKSSLSFSLQNISTHLFTSIWSGKLFFYTQGCKGCPQTNLIVFIKTFIIISLCICPMRSWSPQSGKDIFFCHYCYYYLYRVCHIEILNKCLNALVSKGCMNYKLMHIQHESQYNSFQENHILLLADESLIM